MAEGVQPNLRRVIWCCWRYCEVTGAAALQNESSRCSMAEAVPAGHWFDAVSSTLESDMARIGHADDARSVFGAAAGSVFTDVMREASLPGLPQCAASETLSRGGVVAVVLASEASSLPSEKGRAVCFSSSFVII